MPPKKKNVDITPKKELSMLDKKDLIARIIQLETNNLELKNSIGKNLPETCNKNNAKEEKNQLDFSKCHFRRVLLRIFYFGWDYNSYMAQKDTDRTIEHHLFHALINSCLIQSREMSNYYWYGQTDNGVSSFGQVISISLRSKYRSTQQNSQQAIENEIPYCKILNRLLPKDIKAVAWIPIPEDMPENSARFNCKTRTYKYFFPRSSLDIEAMRLGCARLIGFNDYRNLCYNSTIMVQQFHREILSADVLPVNDIDRELPTSMYYLLIEGDSFLSQQIQCIMGILLLIGERKETPEVISELLDVEKHPRKPQYDVALDVPLSLCHCSHDLPGSDWRYDKHQLAKMLAHLQSEWTLQSIKTTMIKEVINELELQYSVLCGGEITDADRVVAYTDCLIQGDKPVVYTPLLKRVACSSLEEQLEHDNTKKRKIADPDD